MAEQKYEYPVGISTGFWRIARDPALLGLATKISGLGATAGVQFVQIDLESVAEFHEPEVVDNAKKMMTKLGITKVGLHGEIGETMAVDSAQKRNWDQTHDRLCQAVKYAAKMGFFYVNIHFSFFPILSFLESQQRTQGYFYPVVAPDGGTLPDYIRGNSAAEDELAKHASHKTMGSETGRAERKKLLSEVSEDVKKRVNEQYKQIIAQSPDATPQQKEALKRDLDSQANSEIEREFDRRSNSLEFIKRVMLKMGSNEYESYQLEDAEIGAFFIIAQYMKSNNDSLWSAIAKGEDPEKLYFKDEVAFCAAIASKYLQGHVTTKSHLSNKKHLEGMSIKEWCEKKRLYLLFENPEANPGQEGANRLFHPQHYYHAIKNIGSPYVRICVDVEHMVSHALDPDVEFPKLPDDFGKYVYLWHLGQAVPYGGTSHIPIARGSVAQEQIYRWIYQIKKKGCSSAYILFERGSGRGGRGNSNYEVFEDSVLALKQISKYLEMDIAPTHLPPEFFGISAGNKEVWARQVTTIKEHAFDPTEGLLSVPEEKHTFFGKNAVDKGKAQEWEKRKFR